MDVIHRCCAGLDVHKKTVQACIRRIDEANGVSTSSREFGTTSRELELLRAWLAQQSVTHVAMESTGVFWKPVYNVLEAEFTLLLCNAQHVKNVPGRKTDVKDAQWLAELLQFGLLRGSFVPPSAQRELRDLTRTRATLEQEKTAVANRIQKVLEDANIKLSCVATDVLGATGRAILLKLMAGQTDPAELAELARGQLKKKKAALKAALDGHRLSAHHQFMLRLYWENLRFLEGQVEQVDARIQQQTASRELSPLAELPSQPAQTATPTETGDGRSRPANASAALPFVSAISLLDAVAGINRCSAENILAEIGTDMSRFPSAAHLASWAGMCPGSNESAGKKHSGKTRRGDRWLRAALVQAAWGAVHTKKSYFRSLYYRLAPRRGKQRAIIAVAHSLLVTLYHMLKRHALFVDLGVDYAPRRNKERSTRRLITQLEALGYSVMLAPKAAS